MHIRKQLVLVVILTVGLLWTPAAGQNGEEAAPPPGLKEVSQADAPQTDVPPPGTDKGTSQDGAEAKDGKEPGNDGLGGGGLLGSPMLLVMLGALVLMFVFSSRSKKKQAAKRRDMLGALSKGDKITTIGGVVGTVIEVREDELIIKVDETNNIRMRFARWAIRGVGADAKTEAPQEKR